MFEENLCSNFAIVFETEILNSIFLSNFKCCHYRCIVAHSLQVEKSMSRKRVEERQSLKVAVQGSMLGKRVGGRNRTGMISDIIDKQSCSEVK